MAQQVEHGRSGPDGCIRLNTALREREIDFDTVMPGLGLYDFGDMVRSATNPCLEDESDLSKVSVQLPIFKELVAGYHGSARSILNATEIDNLTVAGRLITYEIGLRFLTDHLEGDIYFRTDRPNQNLDRAAASSCSSKVWRKRTPRCVILSTNTFSSLEQGG